MGVISPKKSKPLGGPSSCCPVLVLDTIRESARAGGDCPGFLMIWNPFRQSHYRSYKFAQICLAETVWMPIHQVQPVESK